MSIQGIIATPFGYILDFLLGLTKNYGIALIIFAVMVQLLLVPIRNKIRHNEEKKRRLKPIVARIREEYKDDADMQAEVVANLYNREKLSLVGSFLLKFVPVIILISIFQAVAQPITYLFHETPETAAAIVEVIRQEAPELFVSSYNQITAITHIREYAEIVSTNVPEVSARTLEGLNYSFLGLDLSIVPAAHVLTEGIWAWDWAHIGALLIPIIYMARRIYNTILGIYRKFSQYAKEKKTAKERNAPLPTLPFPPIIPVIFLVLSFTALFSVPVAMNLYWLISSIASEVLHGISKPRKPERKPAITQP